MKKNKAYSLDRTERALYYSDINQKDPEFKQRTLLGKMFQQTQRNKIISIESDGLSLPLLRFNPDENSISNRQYLIEIKKENHSLKDENIKLKSKIQYLEKQSSEKSHATCSSEDPKTIATLRVHYKNLLNDYTALQKQMQILQKTSKTSIIADLTQQLQNEKEECAQFKQLALNHVQFLQQMSENSNALTLVNQHQQIQDLTLEIAQLKLLINSQNKQILNLKNILSRTENKLKFVNQEKEKTIQEQAESIRKLSRTLQFNNSQQQTFKSKKNNHFKHDNESDEGEKEKQDSFDDKKQPTTLNIQMNTFQTVPQVQQSQFSWSAQSPTTLKVVTTSHKMEENKTLQPAIIEALVDQFEEQPLQYVEPVNFDQVNDICNLLKYRIKANQISQMDAEDILLGDLQLISTQHLISKFSQNPFNIQDPEKIILLSRYIIEDWDTSKIQLNLQLTQSRDVVKSIIKKVFGLVPVVPALSEMPGYQMIVNHLQKNRATINQYIQQNSKNSNSTTLSVIKEAFEICGIEVPKSMIDAIIVSTILDSQDIDHLNVSKFLSIGNDQ